MPVIKSAAKQLRQSIKAHKRNIKTKNIAKKATKAVEKMIVSKNMDDAKKNMSAAYSQIDRLVKKNLIHKKTAARRKSKLMKKVNAMAK